MKDRNSQIKLRKQLIEWVGDRSQREAAESINTPLRTLAGWLGGDYKIRGLLAAYLILWDRYRQLEKSIKHPSIRSRRSS